MPQPALGEGRDRRASPRRDPRCRAYGSSCGQRPSLAGYVTVTGTTDGATAAGRRSCCLSSDQFILIDGERFVVQVVTMPAEDRVWHSLHTRGTFTEAGDREKAVDWVRRALLKKAAAKGTIVVLDAHHFGALVGRKLVEAYLEVHPKPVDDFGFKDAWIIGPTPPFSARIA